MFIAAILSAVLTFVELNCENFFDTRHDELKQDMEFLPAGTKEWTPKRFWTKVSNIQSELLSAAEAAGEERPALVALCEVENDYVMRCLTTKNNFKDSGYKYVMTDSPDLRGIDVALIYDPDAFQLLRSRTIRVKPLSGMRQTRDVLYAAGRLANGETLHVIVTHAPSRYGGKAKTQPYRMQTVRKINECIDSIRSADSDAMIIVSGDFNAAADEEPVKSVCRRDIKNISAKAHGSNGARGTYKYQRKWESIDHILVSRNMQKRLIRCFIHDAPFLLQDDRFGGVKPKRTYTGNMYRRGYSDHLPLVAVFALDK